MFELTLHYKVTKCSECPYFVDDGHPAYCGVDGRYIDDEEKINSDCQFDKEKK